MGENKYRKGIDKGRGTNYTYIQGREITHYLNQENDMLFIHTRKIGSWPARRLSYADAKAQALEWGVEDFDAAVEAKRRPDGTLSGETIATHEWEHLPGDIRREWIGAFSDPSGDHPTTKWRL